MRSCRLKSLKRKGKGDFFNGCLARYSPQDKASWAYEKGTDKGTKLWFDCFDPLTALTFDG